MFEIEKKYFVFFLNNITTLLCHWIKINYNLSQRKEAYIIFKL